MIHFFYIDKKESNESLVVVIMGMTDQKCVVGLLRNITHPNVFFECWIYEVIK